MLAQGKVEIAFTSGLEGTVVKMVCPLQGEGTLSHTTLQALET